MRSPECSRAPRRSSPLPLLTASVCIINDARRVGVECVAHVGRCVSSARLDWTRVALPCLALACLALGLAWGVALISPRQAAELLTIRPGLLVRLSLCLAHDL